MEHLEAITHSIHDYSLFIIMFFSVSIWWTVPKFLNDSEAHWVEKEAQSNSIANEFRKVQYYMMCLMLLFLLAVDQVLFIVIQLAWNLLLNSSCLKRNISLLNVSRNMKKKPPVSDQEDLCKKERKIFSILANDLYITSQPEPFLWRKHRWKRFWKNAWNLVSLYPSRELLPDDPPQILTFRNLDHPLLDEKSTCFSDKASRKVLQPSNSTSTEMITSSALRILNSRMYGQD